MVPERWLEVLIVVQVEEGPGEIDDVLFLIPVGDAVKEGRR